MAHCRFPSLTMVKRMVCCWISSVTTVKDGSLVYGTTNNNRMFLDPLWPPNSMLGFGFSSRVHLGVCLLELLFGTNPFVYYHVDWRQLCKENVVVKLFYVIVSQRHKLLVSLCYFGKNVFKLHHVLCNRVDIFLHLWGEQLWTRSVLEQNLNSMNVGKPSMNVGKY